jgi:hypothetical protein
MLAWMAVEFTRFMALGREMRLYRRSLKIMDGGKSKRFEMDYEFPGRLRSAVERIAGDTADTQRHGLTDHLSIWRDANGRIAIGSTEIYFEFEKPQDLAIFSEKADARVS